jgi:tripartite ATP-independent transporter DctM subunit
MSVQAIGLLGMGVLVLLIFLRVPVAMAMGLVGFCGYAAVNGWGNAATVLGQIPFDMAANYSLAQIPLFVAMGDLAMHGGMSARLYDAARAAFVGVRGAQVFATIGACAAFGSVSGSSVATAATMSRIAVPEMRRAGYDDRLSSGSVAAGGSLGILIPPSIPLVIYAIIAEQSVPKLYAAAMIPGLLLTLLYMVAVIPVMLLRPGWVPRETTWMSWRKRMLTVAEAWQVIVLFVVVLGGMYVGWFTATEAAAIGAFGAWLMGMLSGRLGWKGTIASLADTIQTTCMLFAIVFSAVVLTYFIVLTQIPNVLVAWVEAWHLGPTTLMILMMVFYVALGCFLEAFGMLLITVPVFLPVVVQSGFDPIWFGVMLVIVIELGLIHPPVGMNIFVMQAQLPDVPITRLYWGIVPFLWAPMLLLLLLIVFPQIAMGLVYFLFPSP